MLTMVEESSHIVISRRLEAPIPQNDDPTVSSARELW